MAETVAVETRFSVVWPVTLQNVSKYSTKRSSAFSFLNEQYYFQLIPGEDDSYQMVLHPADNRTSVKEPFQIDVLLETQNNESVPNTISRKMIRSIPQIIWRTSMAVISCNYEKFIDPDYSTNAYIAKIVCIFKANSWLNIRHYLPDLSTQANDLNFSSNLESLSLDFSNLLKTETLPDVKLRCGDRIVPAHRSVLAARSMVFGRMFLNGMSESKTSTINVEDLNEQVFDLFLKYLYSGKITGVLDDEVPDLYVAADKYEVHFLKLWCRDRMIINLTEQNCVDVLTLAVARSDAHFKRSVISFICSHHAVFKSYVWQDFCKKSSTLAMYVYQCFVEYKTEKS